MIIEVKLLKDDGTAIYAQLFNPRQEEITYKMPHSYGIIDGDTIFEGFKLIPYFRKIGQEVQSDESMKSSGR